eukprot:TRINITY_DN254_c0_g2_i7.p1 TRINITY_DN254_c0_g2~~TRINITY_DN254_c0_g2_i7.p1  ORF type:complete len:116 (+),score=10.33 TRINITY_DN254_c0_g2_i7:60-407(+)
MWRTRSYYFHLRPILSNRGGYGNAIEQIQTQKKEHGNEASRKKISLPEALAKRKLYREKNNDKISCYSKNLKIRLREMLSKSSTVQETLEKCLSISTLSDWLPIQITIGFRDLSN